MPALGGKAPGFKCADETGKVISLGDFAGNPVVLYFYPKDDTPGCTVEACDFRDSLKRLKSAGVTVLGVSRDSETSHQKFKIKHGLNFPLLADVDGKVCEAYGAWQEKSLYGRKFMGIVRCTFLIDSNGKIAGLWPKVKVAGQSTNTGPSPNKVLTNAAVAIESVFPKPTSSASRRRTLP